MHLRLFLFIFLISGINSLTRQQLRNTGKMLKKSCMGKTKVSEEQASAVTRGQFVEDRNTMCYIACIYQMSGLIKNGKFSYEATIKQIDSMYPPDMKEPFKKSVTNCKDVADNYKDLYELAFWTAKCVYEDNPKNFDY